jgi:hypothetical protein
MKPDDISFWTWLKAYFRWDLRAVCIASRGQADYHDYPDDIYGQPWHFVNMTCKRCGKQFTI